MTPTKLTKTQQRILAILKQVNDGKPNMITTKGDEGHQASIWHWENKRNEAYPAGYYGGYYVTEETGNAGLFPQPRTLIVLLEAGLIRREVDPKYEWNWHWYAV